MIAAGAVAGAGCGDDLRYRYAGLEQVSAPSPYPGNCADGNGLAFTNAEVEPMVAIDPTNDQHLIGAWQQDRWTTGGARGLMTGVSFDGGATWRRGVPRFSRCAGGNPMGGGDYERASDPWIAITADGKSAYQVGLAFDTADARNAVLASASFDGGGTWSDAVALKTDDDPDVFNDKDSITADPTDPGRVYAVWDRLTGVLQPKLPTGTGPTWMARTTGGVWEPARAIYDPGLDNQTIGNVIVALPDAHGTLVDVFNQIEGGSTDHPKSSLQVIRSQDHGDTWSTTPSQIVAATQSVGVQDPKNMRFVRSGTDLPEVAVDRNSGALYVVWEDSAITGGARDAIVIVKSTDGGLTWSAPAQVNGAPAASAFTPQVAVASDGTIGVTYYDTRDDDPADRTTFRATAWLATSHDGGATWTDEPLSGAFDLRPAQLGDFYFLGDYEGLVASGTSFVPFFVGGQSDRDPTDVFARPLM